MTVNIKYKLLDGAKAPFRATPGASGWDLHALEDGHVELFKVTKIRTGLRVAIPRGHELQVRPRSGWAAKHGVTVVNTPGTVDSDFRGEIVILLTKIKKEHPEKHGWEPLGINIKAGDRIAQAVICPVPDVTWEEVEELSNSERGEKGYGSTGL